MKTCCFSGHRIISDDIVSSVNNRLFNLINKAIYNGYSHFISGFAKGVDLMAASIIINLKEYDAYSNIKLEASIPYRGLIKKREPEFQALLKNCDSIDIVSENYFVGCMQKRNLAMIEKSDMLIAVYDGRNTGGTKFTIQKAKERGLEVAIIEI